MKWDLWSNREMWETSEAQGVEVLIDETKTMELDGDDSDVDSLGYIL
jgi:hypothetical protein